jgi:predicted nucleic acid-binding protein
MLIDSSALLAMVDVGDKYHVPAAQFARDHSKEIFHLPEPVFIETMLLVKARLGTQPAVELGNLLQASARFVVTPWTPESRQATWEIFSRYTDKDWSYVDCSLLAAARRLRVSEVFTFDRHFDQMPDVARVPG